MGQTLVVAEKPSVGRDIAAALPGTFKTSQDKTHLVGDEYVVTCTIGHLVGLADPDAYDPKLKKWRYADLPIVPSKFKLVPNDAKAEKQLKAIHRLMRSDDVEVIVNACDAGREGELIFAYTYETSKSKKPVQRLWLSSMTRKAIQEAFQRLRDGDEMKDLEAAARARSEADWVVGMNATRAATIRLRSAFDGAVSLGRVQTPTLALGVRRELEIKPTAEVVGQNAPYRKGADYVMSLESLPLQRVVNDAKVTDHHAIIPTRSEHVLDKMGEDERKVYDLVAKRFLAIFHPDAVFERTRVETTVQEHIFRTSGRLLVQPGWRGVYGEEIQSRDGGDDDTGGEQMLPELHDEESVRTLKVESLSKETQPPRRYTEASLLGAMET